MKIKDCILIALAISVVLLSLGSRKARQGHTEPPTIKVDTLVIRDTIKVTEPVYVSRRVVESVAIPVTDTIRLRDTLYIYLEREQIRWEDSLAVVYASGIMPNVDSVIHYTNDKVITKEIQVVKTRKTKWGIGIQGGYGASKEGLTPYIGVGLTYNILSW